ncbi:GT99 family glycosyltransferase N-terminal domain-containing protein [Erwinia sp. CGal63]|uniref:GT99 family glycosyltransferase N-terminal domain-containing protein n=1 Tax=Erwinia sp. CGal63 TaxID=2919889 RepID=UPI003009796E
MIVAYFPSFPFRGHTAPYLWIFYKLLTTYGDRIHFLTDESYRNDLETWRKHERWELLDDSQKRQGYRLPTLTELEAMNFTSFSSNFFVRKLAEHNGNPTQAFYDYLSYVDTSLEEDFYNSILSIGEVEVVLNWCNCPSLSAACARLNIPVMNMELGPLRHPEYQSTGYLDFSGVNGNTEAAARYAAVAEECRFDLTLKDLRGFFAASPPPMLTKEYESGIVLQVENDSNLIAYANGFNNQVLLDYALLNCSRNFIVRSHPGSAFRINESLFDVDHSPTSIDFIARCEKIITINSSVGLEALLMGVPVVAFGDSSFRFVLKTEDEKERVNRLAFYLFAYLVPYPLIFDLDYIRFRLTSPSEQEIVKKHLQFYESAGNTNER